MLGGMLFREAGKSRMKDDDTYYAGRVEQELELAAVAVDAAVKAIHLDMAARYATLRELTSAPHKVLDPGSTPLVEE